MNEHIGHHENYRTLHYLKKLSDEVNDRYYQHLKSMLVGRILCPFLLACLNIKNIPMNITAGLNLLYNMSYLRTESFLLPSSSQTAPRSSAVTTLILGVISCSPQKSIHSQRLNCLWFRLLTIVHSHLCFLNSSYQRASDGQLSGFTNKILKIEVISPSYLNMSMGCMTWWGVITRPSNTITPLVAWKRKIVVQVLCDTIWPLPRPPPPMRAGQQGF